MGIDFKVIESAILIYILIPGLIKRLEEAHEKMQPYPFFPCNMFLFRTNFILKNVTRNKEKVLINGMKIWNFRADFIIWKRLGE